jgi:hypothetical protein
MKIFGGYRALKKAPYLVVQKHRLVILKRWEIEGKENKKTNDKIEETNSKLSK